MGFRLVFAPNSKYNELRNQPGVVADLNRRARNVAAAAGPGLEVEVSTGKKRARAAVFARDLGGRDADEQRAALLRAIDAAR